MEKTKTVLTGATSGIGYQIAIQLLEVDHHLILANRNLEKAQKVKKNLLNRFPKASIDLLSIDLASLKSIDNFVKQLKQNYSKIDILINNAGVLARYEQFTQEGFELTLGVNHLGTYYLTKLILEAYENNMPKKIIFVSSIGCYWGNIKIYPEMFKKRINTFKNYFDSKLANLIFIKELSDKLSNKNIIVKAADPGVVFSRIWKWKTGFGRSLLSLQKRLMKTPEKGAEVIVKLATTKTFDKDPHIVFTLNKSRKLPKKIRSKNTRIAFMKYTEETIQKIIDISN